MAHWPEREAAVLEGAIPIDRRERLQPEETMHRYLLPREGTPVVVTDAQAGWAAREQWDLAFFKKHYADEALIASDRAPLRHEDNPRMTTLRTTLGDFIEYMEGTSAGEYIAQQERDCPFYGNSWSPFMEHAAMRTAISRPYFVPDSVPEGEGAERLDRSFTKVFLGPAGTITRLHNDTYSRRPLRLMLRPSSDGGRLGAWARRGRVGGTAR
jgi:hypothetical protein